MTPFTPLFVESLPWWAVILIVFLLLLTAFLAVSAGVGIVRFKSFYSRIHTPALLVTLAAVSCTLAAIIFFSFTTDTVHLEYLIIILLLIITTPIASTFLMESARYRDKKYYSNEGKADPQFNYRKSSKKKASF